MLVQARTVTWSIGDVDYFHIDGSNEYAGWSLRRVAVAIASDGRSETATDAAVAAASSVGGELLVIHVRPQMLIPPEDEGLWIDRGDTYTESVEAATCIANAVVHTAHDRGVRAVGVVLTAPRMMIAPSVVAAAADWRADLLVLARRRRNAVSRLLLGSISDHVVRDSSCPVVLVRSPPSSAVIEGTKK